MITAPRVLAIIPARGGSKGIPGKNIRPFVGIPLIAHTIMFARMCPEIDRCIVSTDSPEITTVARQYDADVPFTRPPELAQDDTAMWPVLRHALEFVEQGEKSQYDFLLLLDPTSPAREPSDISGALHHLCQYQSADGVIGVSEPEFNPVWHCVMERDGWMTDLIEGGTRFGRRQEAPLVYRINGSLYIWRTPFVRNEEESWHNTRKNLIYEIPEYRAMSIDTEYELKKAELLVRGGLIQLPWLEKNTEGACDP